MREYVHACLFVGVCLYVRGERRGYVSVEDSWLLLWRKEGHLNCLGDTHNPNPLKEINVDLARGGPPPCALFFSSLQSQSRP